MNALFTILKDNWEWRDKVFHLSRFELVKKVRGSALSWAWLIIKPLVYISCFWFALEIGLRGGNVGGEGSPPFILWLSAGIIPWFFITEILGGGINVMGRFAYLVNKVKFPLSCIPTIYVESSMATHFLLLVVLFVIYFACGQIPDVHLLQVPLLIILMFAFWGMFSLTFSILSAFSKDLLQLIKALRTPIFWLSGAIFSVKDVSIDWVQTILQFNPVTFFITAYRDAFYDKVWFWEDSGMLLGFGIVFAIMLVLMIAVYSRFNEEVADVV